MGILSKHLVLSMLSANLAWIAGAGLPARVSAAGAEAELADIVARMDYGYYAGEARLIEAARYDLERARGGGAVKAYYLGYSAYRLIQLGAADSHRGRHQLIAGCLDAGRAALVDPDWAVEAWVLVAACSLQGSTDEPARRVSHKLRLAEALAAAHALDPDHPRLLLIAAWEEHRSDGEATAERRLRTLERARLEFEVWHGKGLAPAWGKAEALASLGEAYLELGQLREARDLIEQSLMEAPDYHFALGLRNALSLPR